MTEQSGLTPEEQLVADALVEAWNRFVALSDKTPDQQREFNEGIHQAQVVLMQRITRRLYPDYWR